MADRNVLLGKLSAYNNKSVLLSEYQDTKDIIKQILTAHEKYKSEYDKISGYFWKGNVKDSCKYIFDFLKKNVAYNIEPDTRQSVKSPSAILATGTQNGYNDCKHYSLFFAGLLDSWRRSGKNIDWCYRFANYKMFSRTPHHVFVVINPGKNEIWCDAVLDSFNNHKSYVNKIDKKVKDMAMYSISGVGCTDCESGMYGMPVIAGRKERQEKRQARRTARRSGEHCKGRTGAKIAFAIPRKAYLALLRLNIKKLGVKTYLGLQSQNRMKILEKWCSFGGNADLLKSTAEKAYKTYKRKHPQAKYKNIAEAVKAKRMSSVGVAIPALIASALPIITALAKFLPKGSQAEEIVNTATETASEYLPQATTSGITDTTKKYLLYGAVGIAGIYLYKKLKRK